MTQNNPQLHNTIADAVTLVENLVKANEAMQTATVIAQILCAQKDLTQVEEAIQNAAAMPFLTLINQVDKTSQELTRSVEVLGLVLQLRKYEAERGEGQWRELANHSHVVERIKALRSHIPELSLHEARVLIEAYTEQRFS